MWIGYPFGPTSALDYKSLSSRVPSSSFMIGSFFSAIVKSTLLSFLFCGSWEGNENNDFFSTIYYFWLSYGSKGEYWPSSFDSIIASHVGDFFRWGCVFV